MLRLRGPAGSLMSLAGFSLDFRKTSIPSSFSVRNARPPFVSVHAKILHVMQIPGARTLQAADVLPAESDATCGPH